MVLLNYVKNSTWALRSSTGECHGNSEGRENNTQGWTNGRKMSYRDLDWAWKNEQQTSCFACTFLCMFLNGQVDACTNCPLATLSVSSIFLLPFSHTNLQALSELILNSAVFFKTNMIQIKTITIIFNMWNMAQKLVLLGGVNNRNPDTVLDGDCVLDLLLEQCSNIEYC